MAQGIIKGKKWVMTDAQLDYMEKYDEQASNTYHKLRVNNEKIRSRRKVIFLMFLVSIFIINCYIRFGIVDGSLMSGGNKLDLGITRTASWMGVSVIVYLGTLFYGFLITSINNKEILEIAQEYGSVE